MNKKKSSRAPRGRPRKRSKAESESDCSDCSVYSAEEDTASPPARKYSLRKRTAPTLYSDFEYYGLGDEEEKEAKTASETKSESEQSEPEEVEEKEEIAEKDRVGENLIDFEDMIQADILVNENNIDYDNIIQKTEIKLVKNTEQEDSVKANGKLPANEKDKELGKNNSAGKGANGKKSAVSPT